MPLITTLPLGSYQTNCYIVRGENSPGCVLVDPGDEAPRVLAVLRSLGLSVEAILLTHGHFDHVGAVNAIVEETGCPVWMAEADWSVRRTPMNAYLFPLANRKLNTAEFCDDLDVIRAAGLEFTVWRTPGHTAGSVCYFCDGAIFSGDTLFAGSCGRTDLGGSWEQIHASLARIAALSEDYDVYPGHGEATTVFAEKATNPYMGGTL